MGHPVLLRRSHFTGDTQRLPKHGTLSASPTWDLDCNFATGFRDKQELVVPKHSISSSLLRATVKQSATAVSLGETAFSVSACRCSHSPALESQHWSLSVHGRGRMENITPLEAVLLAGLQPPVERTRIIWHPILKSLCRLQYRFERWPQWLVDPS